MAISLGTRLGSYEISSLLGTGGMGEVYRAKDLKLGRDVAIKVLLEELTSNPDRLTRFEQEARSASALNHPNIVTIHDIGRHGSTPFIAMEYVEGDTLRHILTREQLPIKTLLHIAVQIAEGLTKAHSAGIVHRDLKPENLMVTPDGFIKILDFGLAKLTANSGRVGSQLATVPKGSTDPDVVMGTVDYMSPEQAKGQPADSRSDQFSLGAILYEMATGQQAFERETTLQTLSAIIESEPVSLDVLRPDLPPHLRAIVTRCLSKSPADRYPSTRDLARDLKSVTDVSSEPLSSPLPRKATGILLEVPKRNPLLFLAGIIATALVLLVGFDVGGLRDRLSGKAGSGSIESVAVLPLENLSGDPDQEYFADGMTEVLISDLAKIGAIKVISRTSVMQYKGARKPLPEIARELNVDAVVEGSVMLTGERVRITAQLIQASTDQHIWAENYERHLSDVLALQSEVARAIAAEIEARLTPSEEARLADTRSIDPEAHAAYLRGRYFWNKRTEEGHRSAVEHFQQAIEIDPSYALAYAGLADAYLFSEEPTPEEAERRARKAATKALDIDATLGEAHTTLAFVDIFDWEWQSAERGFQRAIELNPGYATAHHWYGLLFSWTGRPEEAFAEMKRAQELDPLSLVIGGALGGTFYLARRYDQSIEQYQKTLEMDANFLPAHAGLASAYLQKGMFEEALAESQWMVDRDPTPSRRAMLGRAHAEAGGTAEAAAILGELKKVDKRLWQRYFVSLNLATIYVALGEIDSALHWLQKAYEDGSSNLVFLKVDPSFDPLRSHPRFQDLLRRLNFPD